MKTYDNGSFYTVSFTAKDAQAFSDKWPCSTVSGAGSFQFAKSNGDLVDAPERATSDAWVAFSQDCQAFGKRELETVTVQFEYTDTFGGDANYSWVRRTELQLPANISDRALVRRAKAWAGLTGCRCTVSNYGDMMDIRPQGSCTVLFVSTVY